MKRLNESAKSNPKIFTVSADRPKPVVVFTIQ